MFCVPILPSKTDSRTMAGISYEEFVSACSEFLKTSEKFGDTWEAKGDCRDEGKFYISKTLCFKSTCVRKDETSSPTLHKSEDCETDELEVEDDSFECGENIEPSDPSVLEEVSAENCVTYEYHVVYSLSHSVPVLYFNAWHPSGKLLTLEEILDRVHSQFHEQICEKKWESLTQQEHPMFGRPFYQLHPCRTAELMTKLVPGHNHNSGVLKKYITSWLSMFGPVIGLELPLYYFQE